MRVYMRDHNRVRRGLLPALSGTALARLNGVGDFTCTVNANSDQWRRFAPGWGVTIESEHGRVLSGPVTQIKTARTRSGERNMIISGLSDDTVLQDMITLPDPSADAESQSGAAYYTAKGTAETVMRTLADRLVGPAARPEYRVPGLVVPTSQARGGQVSVNTRFKILIEEMQALATAGGLNFRIAQIDRDLVLEFFEGRDRSRAVRLNQLDAFELTQTAPTVTEVIVAGQGEGSARTLRRYTGNTSDWGRRITRFQDRRDTDDPDDLQQAGTDTLAEGQEKASLTYEATDQPGREYLRDFDLGDTITVTPDNDLITVTDIVQSAEISWDQHGTAPTKLQVGPVQDDTNAPGWVPPIRALARRLRGLEGV